METISPTGKREHATIDPEWLRAWVLSLALPFETCDSICGLPKGSIADIISRRSRRDENGLVTLEVLTLRKIQIGLSTVRPIFTVVLPPPIPERSKPPDKMVGPLPGMSGRRQIPNYGNEGRIVMEDDVKASPNSE